MTYRTCHNQAKFPSIYVEYPVAQGLQTLIGRLFARRFPLFVSKSKSSVRAEEVDSAVSAATQVSRQPLTFLWKCRVGLPNFRRR